jgi:hypothetical protein
MLIGVGKSKVVFKKLQMPLFGYGNSEHVAQAIENDLYARAFVFKNEHSALAIVNLECWIISHHLKKAIVDDFNSLHKESGLNMQNIMLCAQNTHSAPGGYSHYAFLNLTTGGFHPDVFNSYRKACVDAISKALKDFEQCELHLNAEMMDTASDVAFNRSLEAYNSNPEVVDVSLILTGDGNQTKAIHVINNIAEVRKDCVAVISPQRADVVNNSTYVGAEMDDIITFRNLLPSSSYAVMDGNYKYMYDKYNDLYRYIPLNGDTAGLMVRTDTERDPWYSPAGFNRGQVKNVIKLAFNATKGQRDQLYKAGVNPVVTFPGQGTVLFGDKTLLAKPSAFDRINVRRLFIVLEKAISTAAKFTLFEFNDEFTRAQFRNLVEPFLRDVQGRRGIFDYRVVCDTTNNTGEVIDRNEFIGDIYIKPARSINFIQLNFVAVRTGVEFSEVVGKF